METAVQWWRGLREVAPWFVVEALPPGATLFALLLWLSHRFVSEGFAQVRHYALAPTAGMFSLTTSAKRNWWSCTCGDACACLSEIARGLRRCCVKLASRPFLAIPLPNAGPAITRP